MKGSCRTSEVNGGDRRQHRIIIERIITIVLQKKNKTGDDDEEPIDPRLFATRESAATKQEDVFLYLVPSAGRYHLT